MNAAMKSMPVEKAKDKIAKLLALAGSHNDHEAKAALLAARRLMARYKLTERDVEREKDDLNRAESEYSFSGIKNIWILEIARVIGKHHRCGVCSSGKKGSQIQHVLFVGLNDDAAISNVILSYACEHVFEWGDSIRRKHEPGTLSRSILKGYTLNYALGFAEGLDAKYEEQNRSGDPGMELMVIVPQEVNDFMGTLGPLKLRTAPVYEHPIARELGRNAGYEFNPTLRIEQ